MPERANEFVGNASAVAFLRATLAAGRPAHAYLLTGPAHVGKRTLARWLAAALVCTGGRLPSTLDGGGNGAAHLPLAELDAGPVPPDDHTPAVPGRPCGACRACRLVAKDTHPDVRLVEPEPGKRGVTIEQVRQLEHAAGLRPYAGQRKVFVVRSVDAMPAPAANALLKTLEEPPDDTVLILTASDVSQVLPTVASRCREVALRPVPAAAIEAALVARGMAPNAAARLARLAVGRPGWALGAAADPERAAAHERHLAVLEDLLQQPAAGRLQAAGGFSDAVSTKDVLDVWLGWWRDALLVQQGCADLAVNAGRLDRLARVGASLPAEALWRAMARIQETREQLDANANVRLAVEALLLDLPQAIAA